MIEASGLWDKWVGAKTIITFCFTTLVLLLSSSPIFAYLAGDCIFCHDNKDSGSVRGISIELFMASSHAKDLTCLDCHRGVQDQSHETTYGSGIVNCVQCHPQINKHGNDSRIKNRPECYNCHTKHHILGKKKQTSSVHPEMLQKTCRSCHPNEAGKADALSWLPSITIDSHNKQDSSRSYRKNNCLGCHQGQAAHGEQRPLDKQNCYICHLNLAEHRTLLGYVHVKADLETQPISFVAAIIYVLSLGFLFWGGLRLYINRFTNKRYRRQGESHC